MGLFGSKKKQSAPDPAPQIRRDRDRYYRALKACTPAEVAYVEDALERHGY